MQEPNPPESIRYAVSMSRPRSHLFEVELTVPDPGGSVDVILPSWTPGSYLIRDYARHVQRFEAESGGGPVAWRKTAKDCWRVEADPGRPLRVRFEIYAHDLTVRTCHLDDTHGFFTPAALLPYVEGRTNEPVRLVVTSPAGWGVFTGLDAAGRQGTTWEFSARDYDTVVDSPVECGPHRVLEFEVDAVPHRIVLWGRGNEDEDRIVKDVQRIVEAERAFFGGLPYGNYTFIVHLASGRGGLEHRNSQVLLVERFGFAPAAAYERFLGLVAHELFHVWNVKRLRPAPLGPFDYRRENYTRQLWSMEGITTYYEKRMLLRAGLVSATRFLELLAEDLASLRGTPGRSLQSLEQASFDAWIKHYRPDENTVNSSASYYVRGGVVAALLDLEIRARTRGEASLDDVLRHLVQAWPPEGPGFPEVDGFRRGVETVAGEQDGAFRRFFERFVAGTVEPDLDAALAPFGLRAEWGWRAPRGDAAPAWLGLQLRRDQGRSIVASTRSDGPAIDAGVCPGDELVALDGNRVDEPSLAARLSERTPGESVRLTLFRRDALVEVEVRLAEAPWDTLAIRPVDSAGADAEHLRSGWLG